MCKILRTLERTLRLSLNPRNIIFSFFYQFVARPNSDVILSLPSLEPAMIGLPISADCALPYLIPVVMLGLDVAVMYKSIVVTNTYNQILGSVGYGFLANSCNK